MVLQGWISISLVKDQGTGVPGKTYILPANKLISVALEVIQSSRN